MQIMPVAFSVLFFFFPSGLVLYWLVNNSLQIFQQWHMNRVLGRRSAAQRPSGADARRRSDGPAQRRPVSLPRPIRYKRGMPPPSRHHRRDRHAARARRHRHRARFRHRCRRADRRRRRRMRRSRASRRVATFRDARRRAARPRARAVLSRRRIPIPAKRCSSCTATAARRCCDCCSRAASSSARASRSRANSRKRAFLNGKLDLAQAESVADLIDAATAHGRARGGAQPDAASSRARCTRWSTALIELRMYTEATLDFPEEDIEFLRAGDVAAKLAAIARDARARARARAGRARCCARGSPSCWSGARTSASRACSTRSRARKRRSSRRSPAPRATPSSDASKSPASR